MGERSAKTSTTTPSSGDRVARGPRPVLMTTVAPASASALSSPPFLLRPRSGARHAAPLLKPGPSPPSAPPPPLRQAFSGTHATTTAMPDQHLPNNRPRVSTQGRAPQRPARRLTVPRERLRSRALQLHSNSQSAAGPRSAAASECCGLGVPRDGPADHRLGLPLEEDCARHLRRHGELLGSPMGAAPCTPTCASAPSCAGASRIPGVTQHRRPPISRRSTTTRAPTLSSSGDPKLACPGASEAPGAGDWGGWPEDWGWLAGD